MFNQGNLQFTNTGEVSVNGFPATIVEVREFIENTWVFRGQISVFKWKGTLKERTLKTWFKDEE